MKFIDVKSLKTEMLLLYNVKNKKSIGVQMDDQKPRHI